MSIHFEDPREKNESARPSIKAGLFFIILFIYFLR